MRGMVRAGMAVAVLVVLAAPGISGPVGQVALGQEQKGLRVGIRVVEPGAMPTLEAVLVNSGGADLVVNLGFMLGNARAMLPDALRVTITDAASVSRQLTFFDRRYPGVAGRVDDFVVPLRAGSSYTVRLPFSQLFDRAAADAARALVPGRYAVSVTFEGRESQTTNQDMRGVRLLPFWRGSISSPPVSLDVPPSAP